MNSRADGDNLSGFIRNKYNSAKHELNDARCAFVGD